MATISFMEIIWVMMCFGISVLNTTRQIIYYGLQGRDVPIISYWGYVGMFIGMMAIPTIMNYYLEKEKWT